MSARRARPQLRVPPAVMRLGVRQLGRRCLDPALPWTVQRARLDQLTRTSLLARGTTVVKQAIGGVPAEVVSAEAVPARAAGSPWPWSWRCATRAESSRPAAPCCPPGSISAATAGPSRTWCART